MTVPHFRLIFVTLIGLALAACAVGPDFERPKAPDAKAFDGKGLPDKTDAAGKEGAQTFDVNRDIPNAWWTLFHSKELTQLIAEALTANPDIEAAKANLRASLETASAGGAELFPSLSGSLSSAREKTSGASAGGIFPGSLFTLHNASVSVSYGLDVFGGTRRAIEELEAQSEYQNFQLKAAYLSLTSNIVTTAIQEASLRGQIDATEEIVHDQTNELDILKQQLELGAITEASVLAEETSLEQTKATLPPLQNQLQQTRYQLAALLGQTPDQEPRATFELSKLELPTQLPLSLPVKLIDQRPDIRAAEANLHAASAAIGVATANRLPGIQLNGSIGTEANKIGKLFTPGSGIWNIGGSATETIFDAGALADKQSAAEAEYDVAKANYRKAVLSALTDVANVLSALKTDAVSYNADEKAYNLAVRSMELTQEQFQAGSVNYLALLSSQQAKEQTKLALVQAEARRFSDTAALYQALGGGWWNPASLSDEDKAQQDKSTIPKVDTSEHPI